MTIEIFYSDRFRKDLKKIVKKNRQIKDDINRLIQALYKEPTLGTPLGNNCYKIRLKDSSTNRGKSGGYRVITYLVDENSMIFLLTVYPKSEKSTISDKEIKLILADL